MAAGRMQFIEYVVNANRNLSVLYCNMMVTNESVTTANRDSNAINTYICIYIYLHLLY